MPDGSGRSRALPSFLAGATLRHLRRTGASGLVAVLLGALAVLVTGATWVGLEALARRTATWRADLRVLVVLADPPRVPEAPTGVVAAIRALPGVATAVYVSPEAALERVRRYLEASGAELSRLPANPLPARVEVTPAADLMAEGLDQLVARLGQVPGVSEVEAALDWLAPVERGARMARRLGLGLGGLLGGGALLALSAAARTATRAGGEEAAVLRLVGARSGALWLPPLVSGMTLGAAAAALGLLVLALAGRTPGGWLAVALRETAGAVALPLPALPAPLTWTLLGLGLGSGLFASLGRAAP